jgi:hypothetical protein
MADLDGSAQCVSRKCREELLGAVHSMSEGLVQATLHILEGRPDSGSFRESSISGIHLDVEASTLGWHVRAVKMGLDRRSMLTVS